jgi:hypothetical protein
VTGQQIAIRVDEATLEQLKLRASIERRPVSDIISEAIQEYIKSRPLSRLHMLEMARAIIKEDAPLLNALDDA